MFPCDNLGPLSQSFYPKELINFLEELMREMVPDAQYEDRWYCQQDEINNIGDQEIAEVFKPQYSHRRPAG